MDHVAIALFTIDNQLMVDNVRRKTVVHSQSTLLMDLAKSVKMELWQWKEEYSVHKYQIKITQDVQRPKSRGMVSAWSVQFTRNLKMAQEIVVLIDVIADK